MNDDVVEAGGERQFWNGRAWISESDMFGLGVGGNIQCQVCGGYDQHQRDCVAKSVNLTEERAIALGANSFEIARTK